MIFMSFMIVETKETFLVFVKIFMISTYKRRDLYDILVHIFINLHILVIFIIFKK